MDAERQKGWPALETLVEEMRRIDRSDVADLLLNAVRAGATSGEILDGIGVVLRNHRALYPQVDQPAAAAWDAVMADVNRAYPVGRLSHWFTRLTRCLTRRSQTP